MCTEEFIRMMFTVDLYHVTPSLVGNIAAVACYIATKNTYTIWQFKESTSHSLFETPFVHEYGVIFSINIICLSTCKDLPFTSFQRSLMLSMFLAKFSSVKHAIFGYIAKYCQTCSHIFLSHLGTVNHIRIHICYMHALSMWYKKVHLLNCVDGNREYSMSLKTARMREDNGR